MELAKLRSSLSYLDIFKINVENNYQNVCVCDVCVSHHVITEMRS